jgi:hypothetical protein
MVAKGSFNTSGFFCYVKMSYLKKSHVVLGGGESQNIKERPHPLSAVSTYSEIC